MGWCGFYQKNKEQVYRVFTYKQNKLQAKKFAATPNSERIVFAPHCMRNIGVCVAIEKESYYVCMRCGGCKMYKISEFVRKSNYKGLYVVKGGRTITKIIKEQKPKAIVGIACFFEGNQVFKMLKNEDIAIQFVPLIKDGCSATDTDLTEVARVLNLVKL
jgi:hypothetical protein